MPSIFHLHTLQTRAGQVETGAAVGSGASPIQGESHYGVPPDVADSILARGGGADVIGSGAQAQEVSEVRLHARAMLFMICEWCTLLTRAAQVSL